MAGVPGRSGGRNAKTRQQHELEGTLNATRHKDLATPDVPNGVPDVPAGLEGLALDEWHRMIARLQACRTLAKVDDAVLFQYCRMFAETEAIAVTQAETNASVQVLEENLAGIEKDQVVSVFQEITKLRQLEARYTTQVRQGRVALRAYLVEFGMTPAARSRVRVVSSGEDEHTKSPLARLQQQARTLRAVK